MGRCRWLALLVALPLLGVALSAGTVTAVESTSLSLDPTEGPPGTTVTWVATGFDGCTSVDDVDPQAVVALLWDGVELGRAEVSSSGSATSSFDVPASASLTQHRVVARCAGDDGLTAESSFTVTPPEVVQVPVPNLVGMTEEAAVAALADQDLVRGETSGDGPTVVSHEPGAGTLVDPGTAVDLDLGTVVPDLVVVPVLQGRQQDEAREVLGDAGLRLGGVSGEPGASWRARPHRRVRRCREAPPSASP